MKLSFECDLRWQDLEGASNMLRHCNRCDHTVYNLSGMTRRDAKKVLKLHEGKKVCVHFVSLSGHIVHDGDPLEQLEHQRRGAGRLVAAALIVQAAFVALSNDPVGDYFDPFASLVDALTRERIEPKFTMGANPEVIEAVMF